MIYTAIIEHLLPSAEIRCACENCDWTGTADHVANIGDPHPDARSSVAGRPLP